MCTSSEAIHLSNIHQSLHDGALHFTFFIPVSGTLMECHDHSIIRKITLKVHLSNLDLVLSTSNYA